MITTDAALKRSNQRVVEAGRSSRNLTVHSVYRAIKSGAKTYEEVCEMMPGVTLNREWVESLL